MQAFILYLVAGWSGFFVMAVELLGGRLLAPSFGSSIYVWGALITIFMLALSFGYLVGGKWSVANPSLRRLGLILLAAAFTTLPVVLWSDGLLESMSIAVPDPRFGSLVSATALFFVPTFLSGMISPYAVRLLVNEHEQSGRHAGRLYFVSTFGSAAGTLLTSFYLVLYLEVNQILYSLMAISAAIGIWACFATKEKR